MAHSGSTCSWEQVHAASGSLDPGSAGNLNIGILLKLPFKVVMAVRAALMAEIGFHPSLAFDDCHKALEIACCSSSQVNIEMTSCRQGQM